MTQTFDDRTLGHQKAWQSKPVLRLIYNDMYNRMLTECLPGRTLEIGSGSGNLKELDPSIVSLDIRALPWIDIVADAHAIPVTDDAFDNIVMLDTLHHLERPILFFREASRLLKSNGRLILIEPMISPVSRFFYEHFHSEPLDMHEAPLVDGPLNPNRQPFDSNQAIPTILFYGHRTEFEENFPEFTILKCQGFSLIAYPLSGGYRSWCALPTSLTPALLWFERKVERLLAPLIGFRMIVTLEIS